jgi:hypothetical protein
MATERLPLNERQKQTLKKALSPTNEEGTLSNRYYRKITDSNRATGAIPPRSGFHTAIHDNEILRGALPFSSHVFRLLRGFSSFNHGAHGSHGKTPFLIQYGIISTLL